MSETMAARMTPRRMAARVLRWLALVAFVSMPVSMVYGGTRKIGCEPPVQQICDVTHIGASWMPSAMLAGLTLGIVLLVIAGLMARDREA